MTAAMLRKPTSELAPTFLSASQQTMDLPREASAVRGTDTHDYDAYGVVRESACLIDTAEAHLLGKTGYRWQGVILRSSGLSFKAASSAFADLIL